MNIEEINDTCLTEKWDESLEWTIDPVKKLSPELSNKIREMHPGIFTGQYFKMKDIWYFERISEDFPEAKKLADAIKTYGRICIAESEQEEQKPVKPAKESKPKQTINETGIDSIQKALIELSMYVREHGTDTLNARTQKAMQAIVDWREGT